MCPRVTVGCQFGSTGLFIDYVKVNVKWTRASFTDKSELVALLRGVDVVLNFIVVNTDHENTVGKLLIDAAVEAGVKRFAPSEWAPGQNLQDTIEKMPMYRSKFAIREYLHQINKNGKVIEYTLFQPGIFLDYLGYPQQSNKYVPTPATQWQLEDLRIVSVKGHEDDPLVFTTVADIVEVVRRAVEYDGEWPEIGGIIGDRVSQRQLQRLVEKIRGMVELMLWPALFVKFHADVNLIVLGQPVRLDLVELKDLENGILDVELPLITHPSFPDDQKEAIHVGFWTGFLLSTAKGAWDVTDEWNKILVDFNFTTIEEYLRKVWSM
ncbi:Oxidoreductase BOA1 [Paramyrothecium foliicola]|nr:Oxidoreductase BOA1 [Paramyrothecium foliicola]